jgi:hypothetical protein
LKNQDTNTNSQWVPKNQGDAARAFLEQQGCSTSIATGEHSALAVTADRLIESLWAHQARLRIARVILWIGDRDDLDCWDQALESRAELSQIKILKERFATAHGQVDIEALELPSWPVGPRSGCSGS